MISHRNFVSLLNVMYIQRDSIKIEKDDVHLSYLPLPHLFERAIYNCLMLKGGKIFFYSGDIFKLKDDLA